MTTQKQKDNQMTAAVALICGVSFFLFSHRADQMLSLGNFFLASAAVCAYAIFLFVKKGDWQEKRFGLLCCAMTLFMLVLIRAAANYEKWFITENADGMPSGAVLLFLIALGWIAFCVWLERGFTEDVVSLIIFGAFLMRIFYVVLMVAQLNQNDLGALVPNDYGHMGYVYVLYETGRLPQVNPIGLNQFYQAPLFHMISALFVRLFDGMGYAMLEAQEMLQIVTVFYGTMTLFFVNKIGMKLSIPTWSRAVVMGIAAFLPWGIMQGGALNNDGLMTLLAVMALYYTLVWYEEPTYQTILLMAVCIGCSMMTKISGVLAAPAMAFLMLHKAWTERERWQYYVKQFLCFGVAAFPLGLWYAVRQLVRYGMPFDFVMPMKESADQFIGMYSKGQRFFDFTNAFTYLPVRWDNTSVVDYNIPVSVVKFAVFGELNGHRQNQAIYYTSTLLFWMTLGLMVLTAVAFLLWLFLGRQTKPQKIFVGTVLAVGIILYIKFNMNYRFVCTMHVRYVMLQIYFGLLVFGALLGEAERRVSQKQRAIAKTIRILSASAAALYAASSVVMIVELVQMF